MELPAATVTYDYDDFYRVSYDVEINGSDILTTDYTFVDGVAENSTTILVESMTNAGNGWSDTLSYTYDCKGNIETISEDGEQKAKYYYDELNQLIREDNAWLGKTIAYTYDNGGNILSVDKYTLTSASDISSLVASSTDVYAYTDSNWKDKLTSFNGNAITYDEIGNPLNYYNGYTFTWQNGRELAAISASDLSISYKYNANGIRTEKTVNGVTTYYTLEGTNVVYETNGTDSIWYSYDADGALVSMTLNSTMYYYVTNLQGDITALTDSEGNIVVEYVYDSWGKLITISGTLADTVGVKNPYRYRSYRYDTETGLYYLNSRYYDPTIKRFINADIYVDTGDTTLSTNMFAYCENNSINMADYIGKDAIYIADYDSLSYVGHAVLCFQDKSGIWWVTEYTGSSKKDAAVKLNKLSKELWNRLFSNLSFSRVTRGTSAVLIKGDFSKCYSIAKNYKDKGFGKYNLITNNCLHYVKKILRKGSFNNKLQKIVAKSWTIVPATFYSKLLTADALSRCIKVLSGTPKFVCTGKIKI